MNNPPDKIDGAEVIEWSYSDSPYGKLFDENGKDSISIHGFAICTYDHVKFYRFSCNKNWETEQDSLFDSVEEAKQANYPQYGNNKIKWNQQLKYRMNKIRIRECNDPES